MRDIKKSYLLSNNNKYVLFSGTLIESSDCLRHLNDLIIIIEALKFNGIKKENIDLVIDLEIITHLIRNNMLNSYIKDLVYHCNHIDIKTFQNYFQKSLDKDTIFIASGHGNIDGLAIGEDSFVSPDFFEDVDTNNFKLILIMTQCFAGAFHHLDTRKNICVIGASEYQSSLSINTKSIPNTKFFCNLLLKEDININVFIIYLYLVLTNKIELKTKRKHLISVYKYIVAEISINYQNIPKEISKIEKVDGVYYCFFIEFQKSFLLNKILASECFIRE